MLSTISNQTKPNQTKPVHRVCSCFSKALQSQQFLSYSTLCCAKLTVELIDNFLAFSSNIIRITLAWHSSAFAEADSPAFLLSDTTLGLTLINIDKPSYCKRSDSVSSMVRLSLARAQGAEYLVRSGHTVVIFSVILI